MRSCAYCGRDLAPDEKCNCRSAESARQAKTTEHSTNESANTGWQENTYRTGYTKKPKRKFHFKKPHFKKPDFKGTASGVKGFTKRFVHDPVNTVSNPGVLNKWQIILILIITALGISMCGFFVYSRLLAPIMTAVAPMQIGTYHIKNLAMFALWGTLFNFIAEIIFIGVLYFANRFMLRKADRFFTFAIRPVAAIVPLMVFSILGALISFFSVWATVMLLLTGFVMNIVLTYEALRSEWNFAPAVKTMYLMGASYFIFFVVIFNILRVI